MCFFSLYDSSEDEHTLDCTWQNQYLSASLIDCTTVNILCANKFFFLLADKQLRRNTVRHTISGVLCHCFAKTIHKQKVELDDMLFISLLILYIC